MPKELFFDRGFEVKKFNTVEEKNIFDYRERLIHLGVGMRFNMDVIGVYLEEKDEQKMLHGLQNYFSYLSDGKLQLNVTKDHEFFTGEIVFMNTDGTFITFNQIQIPVGIQVAEIISDSHFKLQDLHIISKSNESLKKVIHDIIIQMIKKYS